MFRGTRGFYRFQLFETNMIFKPIRMVPWLELLPLQTVETTLHLLYPHIQDWGFVLIDDPDNWDKDIFQYFSLSAKGSQISRSSLTLAFQPPWILSDQDIKEFAECRTVDAIRLPFFHFPHVPPVSPLP